MTHGYVNEMKVKKKGENIVRCVLYMSGERQAINGEMYITERGERKGCEAPKRYHKVVET